MTLPFIFILLCAMLAESSSDVVPGGPCNMTDGSSGICTLVNNCQIVLHDLMSGNSPDKLCGYAKFDPVICCPTSPPTTTATLLPAATEVPVGVSSSAIPRENENCSLANGSYGICTVLNNCQSAVQEIVAGKMVNKICGFSGREVLVCCPIIVPVTTTTSLPEAAEEFLDTTTGAVSRRKCREYARYVYSLVYPPIYQGYQRPINVSHCAIKSQKLIAGGTRADRMEFPHMAAVGYHADVAGVKWYCGGTLISETFVLTAAHCISSSEWGDATWVRVGDLNLLSSDDRAMPLDCRIIERIKHPDYKPPSLYHDIALLRLEDPVAFNAWIRPACLHTEPSIGTKKAVATGWGAEEWTDDKGSKDLMKVTLPIVDYQTCNASYTSRTKNVKLPDGINGNWSICAGDVNRDTCQGDGGGPLAIFSKPEYHCMYDVVGITSLGKLCGTGAPGVYTRVYHYISWIENIVWGSHD